MKEQYKRFSFLVGSMLFVFVLYGCGALLAGGAAGGATYAYTKGWVERDYKADVDQGYSASLQAAQKLGMTITEKSKDVTSADIKAKKDDEDYWIKVEETAQNRITIAVRSGIMGDEEASKKVQQEIDKLI